MQEKELERPRRTASTPGSRTRTPTTAAEAPQTVRKSSVGLSTGVRTLEKKNKQLNHATKELEEKMKSLRQKTMQQRTLPKVRASSAPPRELPPAPKERQTQSRRGSISTPASNVTSRIREREAEFQKQVSDRDDQITRLKERLRVLSKKLTENKDKEVSKDLGKLEGIQLENGFELHSIIKQVTKERLQLERHLQIANDSLQKNNGVDLQRYLALETTNNHLRAQLDSLDMLQQEHKLVAIQYREKEEACKELMNSLKFKSALCEDLESQLAKVIEKNTELTMANSDLQRRVVELQDAGEEAETLRSTLSRVTSEYDSAKGEVKNLSGKVRNLESVLQEMQSAAENRREIERQHKEALESLKRKQEEVEQTATKKQAEFIHQLKDKIRELEKEKRVMNDKHQDLILEMAELRKYGPDSISSDLMMAEAPSDNLEIDQIMAKLEQDNKFLEELEKQRAEKGGAKEKGSPGPKAANAAANGTKGEDGSPLHRTSSAITDSGFLSQSSLNGSSGSPTSRLNGTHNQHPNGVHTSGSEGSQSRTNGSSSAGLGQAQSTSSPALNGGTPSNSGSQLHKLPGLSGADKINLLNGGSLMASSSASAGSLRGDFGGSALDIDKDGMIQIPGKGWCFVYVARYSYDPFQHSPNDSPEAELQVNAGDYILVFGDVDEDGFFDGEILDGRRGLVPSNFVEKLEGEDLLEFHQQVIMGVGDCDDSVCTSVPQDLDFISSDEGAGDDLRTHLRTPCSAYLNNPRTAGDEPSAGKNLPLYASCTDLEMTEDEGEASAVDGGRLRAPPPPKHLTLEASSATLGLGWTAPEGVGISRVEGYQVVVDGEVEKEVKSLAGETQYKVTLKAVDMAHIHRVSVKTISSSSSTSPEAACTMVLGKDAPLAPTALKAVRVTSTSATVVWTPSNSNLLHAILVGSLEVKTVKPGVFRHTLAGLQPDTRYKVTIRAKNIKAAQHISGHNLKQLSSSLEVRTHPRGLPEAPVDVQVSSGPTEGTLLVSWLPVTINPSGTSNGAPVTGYVVLADGKRVKDVDDGTADQAVVECSRLRSLRHITVRTKTRGEKTSKDSEPVRVPGVQSEESSEDEEEAQESEGEVAGQSTAAMGRSSGSYFGNKSGGPGGPSGGPVIPQQSAPPPVNKHLILNYAGASSGYPELDSDIGPSELSDIAEEPEEGLTDSDAEADRDTPKHQLQLNNRNLYPRVNHLNYRPYGGAVPDRWSRTAGLQLSSSQFTAQPLISSSASSSAPSSSTTVTSSMPLASKPSSTSTTSVNAFPKQQGYIKPAESANGISSSQTYKPTAVHITHNPDLSHDRNGFVVSPLSTSSKSSSANANTSTTSAVVKVNGPQIIPNKPTQERIRIFVALFDYDPQTMSPNPDSCDEELPFREGQLIKIFGEKDSDGFYWGEAGSKTGYVPCNMVSEVQVDDDRVAEELFREQQHAGGPAPSNPAPAQVVAKPAPAPAPAPAVPSSDRWGDIYEDTPARRKLALYDYDPIELSPNVDAEAELSFQTGDIIMVFGEMDDDGFFMGELRGRKVLHERGLVPSNFLTDVPQGYDPKQLARVLGQQQPRVLGQQKRW